MTRTQPTAADASLLKLALANRGVKARIRRFPWFLRVCIAEPTPANRAATDSVLRLHGFGDPVGGEPFWNQAHEACAYKVA